METIHIIGGGLAGAECAYTLSMQGIPVKLYEMRPQKRSLAHKTDLLGELVCSNSLKADRINSAGGMLKREMNFFGSLVLACAKKTRVPAGGALAVEREAFAQEITNALERNPYVEIVRKEVTELPKDGYVVIATGPLTSEGMSATLEKLCGTSLSFYDAAAPIVTRESVNLSRAFFAARYGRGDDDYLNCPMEKEEYQRFIEALVGAEGAPLHKFDEQGNFKVYEGCMPIEVLAKRGPDTLRFGPLKPVGLTDPHTERRPYAVVQLRAEDRQGENYNLVGFQTNLKFPEQKRVFSMIPGLENAEFTRFGVMHRNTFIDAPRVLNQDLSLKKDPRIFFAGQITGVEGYMESSAMGILAGLEILCRLTGEEPLVLPRETMMGALQAHLSNVDSKNYQPMGASIGLLPPLDEREKDKQVRYQKVSDRGYDILQKMIGREE